MNCMFYIHSSTSGHPIFLDCETWDRLTDKQEKCHGKDVISPYSLVFLLYSWVCEISHTCGSWAPPPAASVYCGSPLIPLSCVWIWFLLCCLASQAFTLQLVFSPFTWMPTFSLSAASLCFTSRLLSLCASFLSTHLDYWSILLKSLPTWACVAFFLLLSRNLVGP